MVGRFKVKVNGVDGSVVAVFPITSDTALVDFGNCVEMVSLNKIIVLNGGSV